MKESQMFEMDRKLQMAQKKLDKAEGDENMKHIIITKCGECPHFEYAYSTDNCRFVCEHIDMNRKPIENANIIQGWCPLDSYKGGKVR